MILYNIPPTTQERKSMSTITIEYFSDYTTYRYRMAEFHKEQHLYKTVVADSHTFQSLYARKEQERINPMEKFARGTDTRQWFSGETDSAEDMIIIHYGQLVELNVVLICHVNRDTTLIANEAVRGPFARGRLASMSLLSAAYQEIYHSFVGRDDQGNLTYGLRTRNDGQFHATTQIDAPNPSYPDYAALFENMPEKYGQPGHYLIYGDTGTGKTRFASTFRQLGDMLVWCFDPVGKDIPYHLGGKVGEVQYREIGMGTGIAQLPYRIVEF